MLHDFARDGCFLVSENEVFCNNGHDGITKMCDINRSEFLQVVQISEKGYQ